MFLLSVLFSLVAGQRQIATFEGKNVYAQTSEPKFAYWTAKGAVDADGSPIAYNEANTGIDHVANAGRPGNWWGIVTENGQRVKQKAGDPNPGFFVSSTSLSSKKYDRTRQCAYADSSKLSFFVIPASSSLRQNMGGVQIGDFGVVVYKGVPRYSMFADSGPTNKIGEGSIFLLEQLGHNPFSSCCGRTRGRANVGIRDGVTYVVFPESGFGAGHIPTNREISQFASGAFEKWGGCAELKKIVPGVACTDLKSPNIDAQLDTKCPNNGVMTRCAGGNGVCASKYSCAGFGGTSMPGTAECKDFAAHVQCCTRQPLEQGEPEKPADEPNPTATSPWGRCRNYAGNCLDSNVQDCDTGSEFVPLKCPGGAHILCCPDAPGQRPVRPPETPAEPCTGVPGQCLDSNVRACGNGFLDDACPNTGPEIKCCPDSADGEAERPSATAQLPTQNVQGQCKVQGKPGVCIQTALCPLPFQSFAASTGLTDDGCRKIPSRSVQCCSTPPAGGGVAQDGGAVAGSGSCAGLFFPIKSGSLKHISVNWGNARSGGKRCHAGLDIYTKGARSIVAVGTGKVTAILKGWYGCSGGSIDAILVYHETGPLAGKTINYGEMNPGTYSVRRGSTVTAGQTLGVARNCGMLHFELYKGRQTATRRWMPRGGRVGSGCTRTSMSTKPSILEDPRPLLNCLKPRNAQFRHGISFLMEADDPSLFDADLEAIGDDDDAESSGNVLVILIVVGAVLLLTVGALAVYCFVVKPRRQQQPSTLGVANEAFADPWTAELDGNDTYVPSSAREDTGASIDLTAGVGSFECQHCGKVYDYADDLTSHVSLRH